METTSRKSPAPDQAGIEPAVDLGRHGESAWLFFPHPVVITDRENRILSANPAARKLVGHESGGNLWNRIGSVRGLPDNRQLSAHDGLAPWSGTVLVESAETGGGEAARLWIIEDKDTDHAHTCDLERLALRERAEMAAEIAHDLNNYLAVITGNAELLSMYLNKGTYDNVPRCLANLRKTLAQIETFTDRCLHLRHPVTEDGTIDLNRFLSDQIAFLRPQQPFRKIVIAGEWGDGLPPTHCDPADLQHAFYSIMRNAAEALHDAPAEKCTVSVRTECVSDANGPVLRILVADDGPGVAADIRDQIFREPVTTKPGRTGYGLLTAAAIARKLGGTVSAADGPDGGTVVTLTLPARDAAPPRDTA